MPHLRRRVWSKCQCKRLGLLCDSASSLTRPPCCATSLHFYRPRTLGTPPHGRLPARQHIVSPGPRAPLPSPSARLPNLRHSVLARFASPIIIFLELEPRHLEKHTYQRTGTLSWTRIPPTRTHRLIQDNVPFRNHAHELVIVFAIWRTAVPLVQKGCQYGRIGQSRYVPHNFHLNRTFVLPRASCLPTRASRLAPPLSIASRTRAFFHCYVPATGPV